jgi:hypothetical protein
MKMARQESPATQRRPTLPHLFFLRYLLIASSLSLSLSCGTQKVERWRRVRHWQIRAYSKLEPETRQIEPVVAGARGWYGSGLPLTLLSFSLQSSSGAISY